MAHVASQRNIANLLKRRNATTIPRDQQKILDQPGSWAVELDNDSQLRVPRHVLETAKEVARASRKQASTEKKEPTLPQGRQPEKILSETNDVAKSVPDSSLDSSIGNATQERFVSWSPSPARSLVGDQPHSPLLSSIKDRDSYGERSPSISRRRESNFFSPPPASQVAFSDGQSSPPPTGHDRANFLELRLTEIWGGNGWLPPSHRDRSRLTLSERVLAALFRVTEIAQLKGVPLQSLWQKGGHLHPLSKSWPDVEEQCLQMVHRMETKYALADTEPAHANSQVLADNDGGEETVALPKTKPAIISRYLAADFNFPSSGPEDALETQLPEAQIVSQAPINRAATTPQLSNKSSSSAHIPATSNTPPCAQPSQRMIPATDRKHPSPPREGLGEPGKKRRRMKPIQFSDPDDPEENVAAVECSRNTTTFSRMAPTKIYTQISSSNSISSSMLVPATIPQSPPIRKSPPQGRAQRASGLSGGAQNQTTGQLNDKNDAIETIVPPTIPELKPFELFTQTYPAYEKDYRGTRWSFIRACVCLDYLMKANSLREYLWDDFIRAFSADYVEYVENTSDPLPALDWFNTLTGAPVFTQLLVKRDTIHDILNTYPDELQMAKSYTNEEGKNRGRDSRSRGSDHKSASPAEPPRVSPQQISSPPRILIDPETVVETVPSTSIEVQDVQNNIPPISPKPRLPSSPTTPTVDREPEKHDTPPAETIVPSTTRLEYPTQVNFPHPLLDTPHPPIPSSARSTATRSSTGTRRGSSYLQRLASSAKDPDAKRRERLRRHFLKKKSGSTPSSRKAA